MKEENSRLFFWMIRVLEKGYHDRWFSLEYHQAHLPILEQTEAKGHVVRAMYLYAGLADLAYEKKIKDHSPSSETLG